MVATDLAIDHARIAAQAAADFKATSVTAIDVSERLMITDVFLVISGSSDRQVRALVDAVEEALHKAGVRRVRREGMDASPHWVLIDFDDIMVHVQQDEDREFYALEKLWADCPTIDLGIELEDDAPSTLDRLMQAGAAARADAEAQAGDNEGGAERMEDAQ
ncbi:ribosome silencing factor [Arcanobacterium haemolyticum]|nr:ribosome silencing factor [Arcanobacterium haemolyticum]